jgi:diguanylate cyclase (GGDEF)-like protein
MCVTRVLPVPCRLLVVCLLLVSTACNYRSTNSSHLDSSDAIRLAALDPSNYGQPVRIEGVVTYYDPEWQLLFVQDSSGGLFVDLKEDASNLRVGQLLEITGKLAPSNIGIANPRFRVLGRAPMPAPLPLPKTTDFSGVRLSQWVQVSGNVRSAAFEDGRLTLTIVDGNRRTKARILDRGHLRPITLLGAKVIITGVSAAHTDDRGTITGIQVFVSSFAEIEIDPAHRVVDPFSVAPQPFSATLQPRQAGQLVHLVGTVVAQKPGRILILSNGASKIEALLADSFQLAPGDSVELVGFTSSSPQYQIEDAIVRIPAPRIRLHESRISGELRTIRELKSLSVEMAAKQLPINVRGTVTFIDVSRSLLFVQDATAGAYVDIHNSSPELRLGDIVRVKGLSGPGDYAPIIAHPIITRLGHGPLPRPLALSLQALASGYSDSGWVQITGAVHSVLQLQSQRAFKLSIAGNNYSVQLPQSQDISKIKDRLLDSQVRVTGVCGALFNEKRQLIGLKFFVPDVKDIEILEPSPTASSRIVRPIVTLLRFDPLNISLHRAKVRGAVTLQDGDQSFYLQDSSAGIYVMTGQRVQLRPGQIVDVSGFPVIGSEGPYLEDATIDAVRRISTVAPIKLTPDEMIAGSYNSQLISIEGSLLERSTSFDQDVLILRSGPLLLRARRQGANLPSDIRRGSLLEVTGILQNDGRADQHSFRIALPSSESVRVIRAASWWTPEHTATASVITVIVILLVLLWVSYNAYRVRSHQAKHDPLTGLQNRWSVLEYLERQQARALRENSPLGIILADVDHFKRVNDTHGHQAGDDVLQTIATILSAELRPYDAVGRYGGEEFLIVVPSCDATVARDIAERIRVRIMQERFPSVLPAESLPVTCSFGIAISSDASWNVDAMLASADRALYAAKNSGRNAVRVADDRSTTERISF